MTRRRLLGITISLALVVTACGRAEAGDVDDVASTTATTAALTTSTASTLPTTTTTAAPVAVTYVVQSGDSLSVIAQRFGVSSAALAAFNGIDDVNTIFAGQSLTIPPADVEPATTETTTNG